MLSNANIQIVKKGKLWAKVRRKRSRRRRRRPILILRAAPPQVASSQKLGDLARPHHEFWP